MMHAEAVPECLRKPLRFGNAEQIAALKRIRAEIAAQEERTRMIEEGELKKYRAYVECRGHVIREIWATSEDEAEKIAFEDEDLDLPGIDWDIDYVRVSEI